MIPHQRLTSLSFLPVLVASLLLLSTGCETKELELPEEDQISVLSMSMEVDGEPINIVSSDAAYQGNTFYLDTDPYSLWGFQWRATDSENSVVPSPITLKLGRFNSNSGGTLPEQLAYDIQVGPYSSYNPIINPLPNSQATIEYTDVSGRKFSSEYFNPNQFPGPVFGQGLGTITVESIEERFVDNRVYIEAQVTFNGKLYTDFSVTPLDSVLITNGTGLVTFGGI